MTKHFTVQCPTCQSLTTAGDFCMWCGMDVPIPSNPTIEKKSVSDKTKLEAIRIELINKMDSAKMLADKFGYEKNNDKMLYQLGRHDSLFFALTYVEKIIKFEE